MSGDEEEIGQEVNEKVDSLASKGYRAWECMGGEGKYRFAGLLGLQ
ncbi:hypothetical protein ACSAZL_15710 [Methanosarcina sp. T3]